LSREIEKLQGWAKHNSFGLRTEWLKLFLDNREWAATSLLGYRQVDSLSTWLKTSGLVDKRSSETHLCDMFHSMGVSMDLPWETLWVNVAFNFPTVTWYVSNLGAGKWNTAEMKQILHGTVPHLSKRTISNAILELVGLLEHTPVGSELKQGRVIPERPRIVHREGFSSPSTKAISYALCRLFNIEKRNRLELKEDLLWPWVIFGCTQREVIQQIITNCDFQFVIDHETIITTKGFEEVEQCGSILTT